MSIFRRVTHLGHLTYRGAKKLITLVVGVTVVLIGVVMIVTPGPAFIIIPLGLAILATEFVWARHLLRRVKAAAVDSVKAARDFAGGDSEADRSESGAAGPGSPAEAVPPRVDRVSGSG